MTENEKRLLENRLSAEVGQPVMVVGSTAGLGEVERRLIEAASAKGAVVVVADTPEPAPQERLKMIIKAMPELTTPIVPYRPQKEWWRGCNPRRFRNA
jgi:hypothetical protein